MLQICLYIGICSCQKNVFLNIYIFLVGPENHIFTHWYSVGQFSAVSYSTRTFIAVWESFPCIVVHGSSVQGGAVQCSSVQCDTMQGSLFRCVTSQSSLVQCVQVHSRSVLCVTGKGSSVMCVTGQGSSVQTWNLSWTHGHCQCKKFPPWGKKKL